VEDGGGDVEEVAVDQHEVGDADNEDEQDVDDAVESCPSLA
jgi:ferredoxin